MQVKLQRLHDRAIIPTRGHPTSAGMDLYCCETQTIPPIHTIPPDCLHSTRFLVGTGLAFAIPEGYGMFIWDRSGLAAKFGLHCLAGVIDPEYRGEVKVALTNLSKTPYVIQRGDRIAQAVISPIAIPDLEEVAEISTTNRGVKGFGSTGL